MVLCGKCNFSRTVVPFCSVERVNQIQKGIVMNMELSISGQALDFLLSCLLGVGLGEPL